mmetsp:Transcript_11804/g.30568  ORF Transcript_11804/g.30568 Transcript_11804/m.30568 type:complete len:219 (-) Transcript_11804:177-833(-)
MLRPVVLSSTRSVSCGAPALDSARVSLHFSISSMSWKLLWILPLVSQIRTSVAEASSMASSAARPRTSMGLVFSMSGYSATTAPVLSAQTSSCSLAAALKVSPAASITWYPCLENRLDSFPTVVVLPPPFTPTMRMMVGADSLMASSPLPDLTLADSSRLTMLFFSSALSACGSLISPALMRSRSPSTNASAAPGPKSDAISASSSSSRVSSESSSFQ